ncbi:hypothetical protein BH09PAT3_BH09PAT3_5320 [soil metagenome]
MQVASTKFLAIDGHGGSGKSTLAQLLAQNLNAEIIHIDDFTGVGSTDDWYLRIIEYVIDPVNEGAKKLSYPRAKWWPEHDPLPVKDQAVTPIMIIEGVGSFRRELRDYMSLKIFVETPREICIARGLDRDRGMGGKTDEEILAMWQQWLLWDDEYFARDKPTSHADYVVDGTKSFDSAVQAIMKNRAVAP